MNQSRSASSLRSISALTIWSTLQLLALFALHVVLARTFGAADDMDAYVAVGAVPVVVAAIVSGPLGFVVIPVYNEERERSGNVAADRYLDRIGLAGAGIGGLLSLTVMLAAAPLTSLLFPGFTGDRHDLAVELLEIVAWLIVLNLLTGFLHAAHHCRRRFQRPGVIGVTGPLLTVALVVAFADRGIHAVAWATVAGALAVDLLLLAGFLVDRRSGPPESAPAGALPRTVVRLLPLLAGAALIRLDLLVDRYLASSLSEGALSHLGYAWRLASAASMIATGGLAVVVFPSLARLSAAGAREEFAAELSHGWRLLCVVLLPIFAAVCLFGRPIVRDFFERGAFTAADTAAVATLLTLYAGLIVAAAVTELASRAFYALGEMRTPVAVSVAVFIVAVVAKVLFTPRVGVAALAAATSVSMIIGSAALVVLLSRRVRAPLFGGFSAAFVRSVSGTAAA